MNKFELRLLFYKYAFPESYEKAMKYSKLSEENDRK